MPNEDRQIVSYMGYGVRGLGKSKRGSPMHLRKWCSLNVTSQVPLCLVLVLQEYPSA